MNRISIYICFIFLLLLISCDNFDKKFTNSGDTTFVFQEPDQIGKNVEVIFNDSGFTKAILKANTGRVYQENQETFLDDNVLVEFFSKEDKSRVSKLSSDSARIDDVSKNMTARGNVVVVSDSSGNRLETSILHWNNSTQKIYSNEFVKIWTRNEIITGYGFESDQNLDNYKINKVSGISYRDN